MTSTLESWSRRLLNTVLLAGCLFALTSTACAVTVSSTDTAIIQGTVLDAGGAAVPQAEISLTPVKITVFSDAQGAYRMTNIPAGKYTLTVSYIGFAPLVTDVEVTAGQTLHLDLAIKVANDSQAILVTASRPHGEAEAINETRSADNLMQVMPSEVITSLPNANVADAIGRFPSVTLYRIEGEGVYIQVRGTEPRLTNVTVNGITIPAPEPTVRQVRLDVIPSGMELFGAFDRAQLATQGLLSASGCADASHVTIYADSDQRTQQTGKAIAQGLMPGCDLSVQSLPEGTNDPLFHSHPGSRASAAQDAALAKAAIAGRIGNDPTNLARAYYPQIAALDHLLATCGNTPASANEPSQRTSLMDIPASLSEGTGDHLAELRGPLATSATLSENLLLEYAEGMNEANVGWGCVHFAELEELLALHTASVDLGQRTPQVARAQASNLLDSIRQSIQQAANQKPMRGAIGKPSDSALFLIGHDTNQENIAGLLNLAWMIDGRRDDTPPGGALIFELWRSRSSGEFSVRTYFTAQTLDQMRSSAPLTLSNPPQRVPVFVPGCSRADMSCPLASFLRILEQASEPTVVPERQFP